MEVGRLLEKSRDNVLEATASMTHEIRRAILNADADTVATHVVVRRALFGK